MKVGIFGNVGIGKALRDLLMSRDEKIDIELVTTEPADEHAVKIAEMFCRDTDSDERAQVLPTINGKTGSNKSDRKRDRKNRWR